jgi:acetone carboxylase gamma subunit
VEHVVFTEQTDDEHEGWHCSCGHGQTGYKTDYQAKAAADVHVTHHAHDDDPA